MFHASGVGAHLAEWVPLSAAVENGSFRCVAYLMANGANPRQRLPAYWIVMRNWKGYVEHKRSVDDEILSEATVKLAAVLARGVDGGRRPHLLRPEGAPKRAVWVLEGAKGVSGPI